MKGIRHIRPPVSPLVFDLVFDLVDGLVHGVEVGDSEPVYITDTLGNIQYDLATGNPQTEV